MPISSEALLISAVVKTGDYQKLNAEGVTTDLFHVFPEEADWLYRFILTHRQAPSKLELKQQFPDFIVYRGADNVGHQCDEVKRAHKHFAILEAANQAMDLVDQDLPDEALEVMARSVVEVRTAMAGVAHSLDVTSDWQGIYADVKNRMANARTKGYAGVPTGFDTLDNITGGLQPGWLTIFAARLGQGKTWAGVKTAFTASQAGKRVIYFSLEQPRNQIAMRVHAFGSKKYAANPFNPMDLARGSGFDLLAYKRFLQDMADNHASGNLLINDTSRGRLTPASIAGTIEIEQPDLIIIDYLTLLGGGGDDWRGSANLVGDVQSLGHTYGIPIVALAQINRTGAGGKEPPGAESLYQSDAIGHDADLLVTQMQKSEHVMMHKIAKFRHGPAGSKWYSEFDPSHGVFEEMSGDEAQAMMDDDHLDEED
jgi:replicative DNA helicase